MKLLPALVANIARPLQRWAEKRMSIDELDTWMDRAMYGTPSASGVDVSGNTALTISAVFAAVRLLAETVASLPLHVYKRREGGGKEKADGHPLYRLLHDQPNPELTSFEWRETMMGCLALRGNAYSEIEWGGGGAPIALWFLHPDRVRVIRSEGGALLYKYRPPNESTEVTLPERSVLHLRGLSSNGITGLSPLALARETFGMTLAAQEYGARFYKNDSRPGGILQAPGKLSKVAFDRLKESWAAQHEGLSQAHRLAILEEGMTWHQIGLAPEDAQFIESRKFQVTEIARFFNIPPHFLRDLERATFGNIEQQSLEFVVYTLRPWLVRWEQRLHSSLLLKSERGGNIFTEFAVQGLLRGDLQTRYGSYATAKQNGWMNADEIRELENMNPIADGSGQEYWRPANMMDASDPASMGQPTPPVGGKGIGGKQEQGGKRNGLVKAESR